MFEEQVLPAAARRGRAGAVLRTRVLQIAVHVRERRRAGGGARLQDVHATRAPPSWARPARSSCTSPPRARRRRGGASASRRWPRAIRERSGRPRLQRGRPRAAGGGGRAAARARAARWPWPSRARAACWRRASPRCPGASALPRARLRHLQQPRRRSELLGVRSARCSSRDGRRVRGGGARPWPRGRARAARADIGVGITGIAGPGRRHAGEAGGPRLHRARRRRRRRACAAPTSRATASACATRPRQAALEMLRRGLLGLAAAVSGRRRRQADPRVRGARARASDLRARLGATIDDAAAPACPGVRWVRPDGHPPHPALPGLGAPRTALDGARAAAGRAAAALSRGRGRASRAWACFPSAARPRVLWVGVELPPEPCSRCRRPARRAARGGGLRAGDARRSART